MVKKKLGEDYSLKEFRKAIQFIFQDPYSSLNPRMRIIDVIKRPLQIFYSYKKDICEYKALELLKKVSISEEQAYRYPHELSGGQRQRVCIARGLSSSPELIVADEPTSALDVSIQCQILDILSGLKRELDLTMLFISHDLGVVDYISDRVIIMYLGKIMEAGYTREIFSKPMHPYTMSLLEAIPKRGKISSERKVKLKGNIPSPINPPTGCRLNPRCPFAEEVCVLKEPEARDYKGRFIYCHFAEIFLSKKI